HECLCGNADRPRRGQGQCHGAAPARQRHWPDGGGQVRWVRPRHDPRCAGGPGGRRELARGGHRPGGTRAARRGRDGAGAVPDGRAGIGPRGGRAPRGGPVRRDGRPGRGDRGGGAAGGPPRPGGPEGRDPGGAARRHLKADTGMSRGGATAQAWPDVVGAALAAEASGDVAITGIFSHLACADMPGHPSVDAQIAAFRDAVALAEKAGARPEVRHLANTPATLTLPQTWFDLVRTGGGVFGLSTLPGGPPGWLRPAMTVRARLIQVKRVAAGSGVSYGHRYITPGPSTLGLVPLGYADGVPRGAFGLAEVHVRGRRRAISGTVCMNQFVVDFGDGTAQEGDEVVLFGPGDAGEPTPQDWADALGTISYEIVTRFGGRTPRSYSGVTDEHDSRIPASPA